MQGLSGFHLEINLLHRFKPVISMPVASVHVHEGCHLFREVCTKPTKASKDWDSRSWPADCVA